MKKHKDLNNIIPFSQNFIHSTLFEKLKVDIFLKPVLMNAAKSKILEKKKMGMFCQRSCKQTSIGNKGDFLFYVIIFR